MHRDTLPEREVVKLVSDEVWNLDVRLFRPVKIAAVAADGAQVGVSL